MGIDYYFLVAFDMKHIAKIHLRKDIYWITEENSLIGIRTYTKNVNFGTIGDEINQKLLELEFPEDYDYSYDEL